MRGDVAGEVLRQDDPDAVRREYADEKGLSARIALWARRPGPQPQDVAFDELIAAAPQPVVEVGCGRGEFAEALVQAGIEVVAVDQSPRMVELTAARGIDARIGDIQKLSFPAESFDAAVANFMLYHVPDLDRGLSELARVLRSGGVLVAATISVHQLAENVGTGRPRPLRPRRPAHARDGRADPPATFQRCPPH